ncbi:MAG TPA: transposase [Caulobacteraceae bacterium]|nr:transposase [Caulobacteraceae bacterium]
MSERGARSFSRAFKLAVIERLEAGESATALGRELGVRPTLIHQWRSAWRQGGAAGLRRAGRPRKDAALEPPEPVETQGLPPPARGGSELAAAQRRIAELERKVGQQQLDLDFFRAALRHFEASGLPSGKPGARRPSPSSRR